MQNPSLLLLFLLKDTERAHWTSFLVDEIILYFLSKRRQINLREGHYNRGQKQFSGRGRRAGISKAGFLDQPAFCCVTLCKGNSPHYYPSSFLEHTPIQDTVKTKLHAKFCMTIKIPHVIYFYWGIFLLPVNSDDGLDTTVQKHCLSSKQISWNL